MPLSKLIKEIMDRTSYSGNSKSGKKIISASSITNDILPEVLKFRNGLNPSKKIEQNTLGSIFQLGMDSLFSEDNDKTVAMRLEYTLKNGWKLSGELDLLYELDGELLIVDFKLSKESRTTIVEKDGVLGDYALQLRAYEFLITHSSDYYGQPIRKFLFFGIKDQSYFAKNAPEDSIKIIEMNQEDSLTDEQFLEIINERIDELDTYIDSPKKKPPQCKNLFWSRKEARATPVRCTRYCSVSEYCSYARNPIKKDRVNKLMGLINSGNVQDTPNKKRNAALDL